MRLISVEQGSVEMSAWEEMERPEAGELYHRYAPAALRFAYLLTGDIDLAHDLVQDAFVKLLARPRILNRHDAFDSYLRSTIMNLSRSRWRRVGLERRHRVRLRVDATGPERSYEERDALKIALATLPERQRCAVVLRYLEDLSEQQTAEIMNTSVPAVKSLVQRAMATLRRYVEGPADG